MVCVCPFHEFYLVKSNKQNNNTTKQQNKHSISNYDPYYIMGYYQYGRKITNLKRQRSERDLKFSTLLFYLRNFIEIKKKKTENAQGILEVSEG